MIKACIITFILLNTAYAQVTSSLQAWDNILQIPKLVDYFRGIFNHLGITAENLPHEPGSINWISTRNIYCNAEEYFLGLVEICKLL